MRRKAEPRVRMPGTKCGFPITSARWCSSELVVPAKLQWRSAGLLSTCAVWCCSPNSGSRSPKPARRASGHPRSRRDLEGPGPRCCQGRLPSIRGAAVGEPSRPRSCVSACRVCLAHQSASSYLASPCPAGRPAAPRVGYDLDGARVACGEERLLSQLSASSYSPRRICNSPS